MKGDIISWDYKSDIEIAQETVMEPITAIAEKAGIDPKYLEQYGNYKAKIDYNLLREDRGQGWQADPGYRYQPDTRRRRKNHYYRRSGRCYAEAWQESNGSSS